MPAPDKLKAAVKKRGSTKKAAGNPYVIPIVAVLAIVAALSYPAVLRRLNYEPQWDEGVRVLTDDDFSETAGSPHAVMFYAPWCGHCKALKPKWEELAEKPAPERNDFTFAKVDCTDDNSRAACKAHDVRGFPTVVYFDGAEHVEYSGGRTVEDLLAATAKGVRALKVDNEEKERKEAEETRQREIEEANSPVNYLSDADFATPDFKAKMQFVFFHAPWCGHCKKLAPDWEVLAQDEHVLQTVGINKADCTGKAQGTCGKLGVKSYPTLFLFGANSDETLKYEGGRTQEDLRAFIAAATSIKAARAFEKKRAAAQKAQEAEEARLRELEEANSPVTFLDDATAEGVVAKGPVFVKFFAPWCGHCKAMAQTWEDLAAKEYDNGMVIAKADCTGKAKAFCGKYDVTGFPTLRVLDGESVVDYDGGRDLEALEAFARGYAS